jgi:SAM-dependent methyltransferase
MATDRRTAGSVIEAYWLILGRAPSPLELDDELRGQLNQNAGALLRGLLSSPEFDRRRTAWRADRHPHGDAEAVERGLVALGAPDAFVRRAYDWILGRPADADGAAYYVRRLAEGERRANVVRALVLSDEFTRRWNSVPRDSQLCELANPAKWDNDEWLVILRSLGLSDEKLLMHRKPYEFAQFIYGCRHLGALREDSVVLSVGAGHELVLYWLANHVRRIVATDMYEGVWQEVQGREGDPDVLRQPDQYAPFAYRKEALAFLKMDGRELAFRDRSFDIAYSLSSIEHFGGIEGASTTIREMGRVLKPGGILALATEYVIAGPRHVETFQPAELDELIQRSGLALVEPIDDQVYRRYRSEPVDLYANPYQTPHMLVRFNDTVFTSVMVFLRKQHGS